MIDDTSWSYAEALHLSDERRPFKSETSSRPVRATDAAGTFLERPQNLFPVK